MALFYSVLISTPSTWPNTNLCNRAAYLTFPPPPPHPIVSIGNGILHFLDQSVVCCSALPGPTLPSEVTALRCEAILLSKAPKALWDPFHGRCCLQQNCNALLFCLRLHAVTKAGFV